MIGSLHFGMYGLDFNRPYIDPYFLPLDHLLLPEFLIIFDFSLTSIITSTFIHTRQFLALLLNLFRNTTQARLILSLKKVWEAFARLKEINMIWKTLQKVSEESGMSQESLRALKKKGILLEKIHWVKTPNGRILINTKSFEKWLLSSY